MSSTLLSVAEVGTVNESVKDSKDAKTFNNVSFTLDSSHLALLLTGLHVRDSLGVCASKKLVVIIQTKLSNFGSAPCNHSEEVPLGKE